MFNENSFSDRKYSDDSFTNDETMRLFSQPDVLCVNDYLQVYQAKAADTPEKRLVLAVLRDAIDCYIHDCFSKNRHRIRPFREAEEWFFKGEEDGVFSLNNVCAVLHLDPGYIRRSLRNYEKKHSLQASLEPAGTRVRSAKNVFRMAS